MQNVSDTAIIILAAGSSSRLGEPKQLLKINGETLLEKSMTIALQTGVQDVFVVLGAGEKELRPQLENRPVHIIQNMNWSKGIGSSLKAGLARERQYRPDIQCVVIMVCDQPHVTASHLMQLLETHHATQKAIVASSYSSTAGVPVLFAKSVFTQLEQLEDGHGAKKIMEAHPEFLETVDFPGGSIDLDTPDDVRRFRQEA